MGGAFSTHGRDEKCVHFFFPGKPEGKRPVGGRRRRWKDNVIGLREIGWEGVGWMYLAQSRDLWRAVMNTVMNLRAPYKAGNLLTS